MSAVEQACKCGSSWANCRCHDAERTASETLRALLVSHGACMEDYGFIGDADVIEAGRTEYVRLLDALIAAVRAERDAAWREGVEAVRGTMPGINKRPDEVSNDAFYETRGMENALDALAARMEAK